MPLSPRCSAPRSRPGPERLRGAAPGDTAGGARASPPHDNADIRSTSLWKLGGRVSSPLLSFTRVHAHQSLWQLYVLGINVESKPGKCFLA